MAPGPKHLECLSYSFSKRGTSGRVNGDSCVFSRRENCRSESPAARLRVSLLCSCRKCTIEGSISPSFPRSTLLPRVTRTTTPRPTSQPRAQSPFGPGCTASQAHRAKWEIYFHPSQAAVEAGALSAMCSQPKDEKDSTNLSHLSHLSRLSRLSSVISKG